MKHKNLLLFFLVLPLISMGISFTFSINAIASIVLFYGLPAFVLSLFKPHYIKKAFLASIILFPIAIVGDYIAEKTKAWVWPLPHSVFAFKFFAIVSIESVLWVFLQTYATIIFFQFFSGATLTKKSINKRSKIIILTNLLSFILFPIFIFFAPILLNIPYFYLLMGIFFLSPIVLFEEFKYPKIFHRLVKTAMYFAYLNFSYEITALSLGLWRFPSTQYIGTITFLKWTFPLEELIFWIIISSFTVLSYYEYFFNGER